MDRRAKARAAELKAIYPEDKERAAARAKSPGPGTGGKGSKGVRSRSKSPELTASEGSKGRKGGGEKGPKQSKAGGGGSRPGSKEKSVRVSIEEDGEGSLGSLEAEEKQRPTTSQSTMSDTERAAKTDADFLKVRLGDFGSRPSTANEPQMTLVMRKLIAVMPELPPIEMQEGQPPPGADAILPAMLYPDEELSYNASE